MLDQVPEDTGNVCGFPCENAYVVPQKSDDRVFLFGVQVGSDESYLLGVAINQSDFLVFLGLDVLSCGLLLGYLELVGWSLCCLGHGFCHPD